MDKGEIEQDFHFLKNADGVLALVVYGSKVEGGSHERSDVDICIVAPSREPLTIMKKVWRNVNLESNSYDVHTFEELPLKVKKRIIDQHELIWCRYYAELQLYFHHFRKIWNDQSKARGVA
jgi:predicted nucleotidyltransferase